MATRKDKQQRLQIASPCSSSWEAMHGDERRRHCLECDKRVYDFARLTQREIDGVIEASRGDLCARLTRDGWGRLVTLQPAVTANPLVSRRPSPLVTAMVTAALGLGGTAWTAQAALAAPAAEQGAGNRPEDNRPEGHRPQRSGEAGGSLRGRVVKETGEPVPKAEIKLNNQLDGRERVTRADAEGRFSFGSVTAGIYGIEASVDGHTAVNQEDVLLSAEGKQTVELTVPSDFWQSLADGATETVMAGGLMVGAEPLRRLYEATGLVVLAVAGKSVTVGQDEYTAEVRTDLVISSVLKGDTRERVISVYHDQMPEEGPAGRYQPGDKVLAFLKPREAEAGRGSDGYVTTDALGGLRKLSNAELDAYRERILDLARIARSGAAQPAEILEWLVTATEDPVTRQEAIGELSWVTGQVERQAEQRKIPVDLYAQSLRDVYADFLGAGGRPEGEMNPLILGAFFTDAHRQRLTAALLNPPKGAQPDFDLYNLVAPWHEDRLLPWVIDQLKTADLSGEAGYRLVASLGDVLYGGDFAGLPAGSTEKIMDLEEKLYSASKEGERQRLGVQLKAAQEDLRRQLAEALAKLSATANTKRSAS